jgi:F-type H+-transporting ATPase subunit alpha
MRAENEDLLHAVRDGDWSDDTQESLRTQIGQFADDFGYDLDEEGQPLGERETTTREQEGLRETAGARDGGSEEGAPAEGAEAEEAGAVSA